jgi:hypothetical protein
MPAAERKRPFYAVLALLGALALGTTGASSGWVVVETYREPIDPSTVADGVADDADRAAIVTRFETYLRVLDAARSRGWPIAVAMLVLGTAVLFTAVRTLGGSKGARHILVQMLVAQAALSGVSYWALRDVNEADLRWQEARQAAKVHEEFPQQQQHEYADEVLHLSGKLLRLRPPIELALGTLCSALIVLALTRQRAREFFDAPAEALGGR